MTPLILTKTILSFLLVHSLHLLYAQPDSWTMKKQFGYGPNAWGSYDPEGGPITFSWAKTAGPSAYNILYSNSSTPVIYDLVTGTYTFQLTVTDDQGAIGTTPVTFAINASALSVVQASDKAEPNEEVTLSQENRHVFLLFPNPTKDLLNLKWSSTYKGNLDLRIIDGVGRVVKIISIRKQQVDYAASFNVSALNVGTYSIWINTAGGRSFVGKFLKTR